MGISIQTLSEADRRLVAEWAAVCAERVLPLFEAECPDDERPRAAIARTRAFARGELDTASETRRRFGGGSAYQAARRPEERRVCKECACTGGSRGRRYN